MSRNIEVCGQNNDVNIYDSNTFIELTNENNSKFLINVSGIDWVRDNGMFREVKLRSDLLFKVKETYEEIKKLIRGK